MQSFSWQTFQYSGGLHLQAESEAAILAGWQAIERCCVHCVCAGATSCKGVAGRHLSPLAASAAGARRGHAMQFFSWKAFQPVGQPLVDPKWIAWDPDVTVAALAHADGITLCRTRPSFKAFASLPIEVAILLHKLGRAAWHVTCRASSLGHWPRCRVAGPCKKRVQSRMGCQQMACCLTATRTQGPGARLPAVALTVVLGHLARKCHELSSSSDSVLQSFRCTFCVLVGVTINWGPTDAGRDLRDMAEASALPGHPHICAAGVCCHRHPWCRALH